MNAEEEVVEVEGEVEEEVEEGGGRGGEDVPSSTISLGVLATSPPPLSSSSMPAGQGYGQGGG